MRWKRKLGKKGEYVWFVFSVFLSLLLSTVIGDFCPSQISSARGQLEVSLFLHCLSFCRVDVVTRRWEMGKSR